MPTFVDSLKTRYDAVFQTDTDSLFYQNLHHYFDFVVKTPVLNELFEASEKDYYAKHGAIWGREKCKTDKEADEKHELTMRLERFNMFCHGCTILVRVYLPLEDYKNNTEPEFEQDPVAVLMIRGIKNINPDYAKENPFKWNLKHLKMHNRWFEGQRGRYEQDLRQFHLALLAAIEDAEATKSKPVQAPPAPKLPLIFYYSTGDFRFYAASGTLAPTTQMYKILSALLSAENYRASFLELWQSIYPQAADISKPQKQQLSLIIRNIKQELGILPKTEQSNSDIIESVHRFGYRLVFSDEKTSAEQS